MLFLDRLCFALYVGWCHSARVERSIQKEKGQVAYHVVLSKGNELINKRIDCFYIFMFKYPTMKKAILFMAPICGSVPLLTQADTSSVETPNVFRVVEQMPAFPGGETMIERFVQRTLFMYIIILL